MTSLENSDNCGKALKDVGLHLIVPCNKTDNEPNRVGIIA
jgi:hypothetical protein